MGLSSIMGEIVLSTKKHSPEIKFIFGVITLGGALYSTHKAALKSQEILEKKKEQLQMVEDAKQMVDDGKVEAEEYTPEDEKNDIRKINAEYFFNMSKNYIIPAGLTIASICFFHGAVTDWKNFAVSIGAAYNALVAKHNDEMKFFKEQLGEEKFDELEMGFKTEQIKQTQECNDDPRAKRNQYSRFFDELHPCWTENPEVNKTWLLGKQNFLDAKLQNKGYLLLNEIYEELGYPPTQAGQVMGILRDNPDGTRNHLDFGIFNIHDQASRWFVNGLEPIFLININVDPRPIIGRIEWALL